MNHRRNGFRPSLQSTALALALIATPQVFAVTTADLPVGKWVAVSSNTISSVNACPGNGCSYSGNEGQAGVVNDWSGGAYASGLGTYGSLLVFGGGHGGYLGNEVYAFDVSAGTWSRLTNPVATPTCDYSTSTMAGNSPCAAHMYEALEYSPVTNEFVKLGSASDGSTVLGTPYVHALNLQTKQWRRGARMPTWGAAISDDGEGAATAWDSRRNVIWWQGSWRAFQASNKVLRKYDPVANTWTEYPGANVNIDTAAAFDSDRQIFLVVDGRSNNKVYGYDTALATPVAYQLATTGDLTAQQSQAIGLDWDATARVFVAWVGGSAVYTLSPPVSGDWRTGTWVWKRVDAAAGNTLAPSQNANGTYGRFRYVPALNSFIVVNGVNSPTYMYRLTASGAAPAPTGPAPTVDLMANPGSTGTNGATTLSWSSANATTCTASGAWSGAKATSGSQSIGPLTATGTYTLGCTGTGGTTSKSTVVIVVSTGPLVTLTASPDTVTTNGSSVLSWSASNATSCTASGGWTGSKPVSGTQTVGPLTAGATYTLSCTGSGGTNQKSAVVAVQNQASVTDFQSRCAGAGVVKCVGFDSSADFAGNVLFPAWDGVVRGAMDTNIKASGTGSLRFTIPTRSSANTSGYWLDNLGGNFGQNSTFYVQFRQRFSPEMLTTNFQPGGGWKQVIIHGNASCASVELTTVNNYLRGYPTMYTDCGARSFDRDLGNGNFLYQQGDYNCYRYPTTPGHSCGMYRPSEWMTFYYEIQIGQWKQPNSSIRAYMAYEGQPLKKFVDVSNYALDFDSSTGDTYHRIQLTPYMTGKVATQDHPTAYTWYDELVVSRQPIPAPNGPVAPAPVQTPAVALNASAQSVTAQGSATLNWSATNADSCTASGGWSGSKSVSGSQTVGPLSAATTFTLTCVNAVGVTATGSTTVAVTSPTTAATPGLDFYAQPSSIQLGQSSRLYWTATNASSCVAANAWGGSKTLSGSEPIFLDHDVTYGLTCSGAGGSVTRSVPVQVVPIGAPTVSLDAIANPVPTGSTTILRWSTTNTSSCTASFGWTGNKSLSGSQVVGPLTKDTLFALSCNSSGLTTVRRIIVAVQ